MIFLCLVTDVFCVAYRNDEVIGTKGVKGGTEVWAFSLSLSRVSAHLLISPAPAVANRAPGQGKLVWFRAEGECHVICGELGGGRGCFR